jgi:hypothetical protein
MAVPGNEIFRSVGPEKFCGFRFLAGRIRIGPRRYMVEDEPLISLLPHNHGIESDDYAESKSASMALTRQACSSQAENARPLLKLSLSDSACSLLAKVQEHEKAHRVVVSTIQADASALLKAANKVGDSWSGSNIGYHGELYYAEFQRPPLGAIFSVEWGTLHGIPPNWNARTPEDVKEGIESLAGVAFSKIEDGSKQLIDSAKELQSEILIELAPLHEAVGLIDEKKLVNELETFDWAHKTQSEYCVTAMENFPKYTRDSDAAMRGVMLPAHTYYEAVAEQLDAFCEAVKRFWQLSRRLLRQIQIQAEHKSPVKAESSPLTIVRLICKKFHAVAVQLRNRRQNRQTLTINDEYDVQDLLNALLRLCFADVRPEEPTPSFGGGASRMDFLLKGEKIVVEAKMARASLRDKELCDELIQDVTRYKNHGDCKTLVCLVYDPNAFIKNPHGVESDIRSLSSTELEVEAFVVPER